ncbi:hypothetical protein FISHEDRAFT_50890 [Fistulina hepatica ATCC 64428]|uniref:Uncharacterized protein n=1 Tax=Fistulina hepatica ATCC 64428 TaxID=1128425 RepID=A0A0D7A105_9AGAR|nr:hypothetical protein FISHEDRAFT_50890 [Fistulina hepatica ATCC 64428]
MGGPNLEVFKFTLYLAVPIFALLHFGDPDWYRNVVVPYREKLFPPEGRTNPYLPKERANIRAELERLKTIRLQKHSDSADKH